MVFIACPRFIAHTPDPPLALNRNYTPEPHEYYSSDAWLREKSGCMCELKLLNLISYTPILAIILSLIC